MQMAPWLRYPQTDPRTPTQQERQRGIEGRCMGQAQVQAPPRSLPVRSLNCPYSFTSSSFRGSWRFLRLVSCTHATPRCPIVPL